LALRKQPIPSLATADRGFQPYFERVTVKVRPEREPPKQSHVSKMTTVPPTYAASQVVGLVQRKSAIELRCAYGASSRNFSGGRRWARRYFVLATGPEEEMIRTVCGIRDKRGNVRVVEPPALTGHFSGLQFWGRFERPMF
jgi:hypothetical protein